MNSARAPKVEAGFSLDSTTLEEHRKETITLSEHLMKKQKSTPEDSSEQQFIDTLKVSKKNQYGKLHYYPQNDIARRFVHLLKQKSFNQDDLERIKLLNYRIVLVPHPIEETEL